VSGWDDDNSFKLQPSVNRTILSAPPSPSIDTAYLQVEARDDILRNVEDLFMQIGHRWYLSRHHFGMRIFDDRVESSSILQSLRFMQGSVTGLGIDEQMNEDFD